MAANGLIKSIMLGALFGAGVSIHSANAAPQFVNVLPVQQIVQKIKQDNPNININSNALMAGVRAYAHLRREGKDKKHMLTIVNYDLPSNDKRLWVIDMANAKVKYHTYVAHGSNSGLRYARYFSNVPESYKSSIGVYLTGKPYYGVDGYSMRLHGLDKDFNSNVYRRHIVMHPAWYVSKAYANKHDRVGRTHGCFGIDRAISRHLINSIKEGTVMVVYYPNQKWLNTSIYERPLYSL